MGFAKIMKSHINIFILLSACLCLLLANSKLSLAQEESSDTSEEERLREEETVRELKAIPPPIIPEEKKWSLKTGWWLTSIFRDYTDTDNDANDKDLVSWSWYNDFRIWGYLSYSRDYSLFVRLKHAYTRRDISARSSSYEGDHDGPHLDMAYVHIKKGDWRIPIDLTIGRQYFFIGRGIAYSNVHYGLKYKTNLGRLFYLKTFASMADENEYNIDESVPNYKKTNDRIFAGIHCLCLCPGPAR